MKVLVSKSELRKLRKRMRDAYPNERIEYIWGHAHPTKHEVHIYVFDQVKHKAGEDKEGRKWCKADDVDSEESVKHAEENGLTILGSIHSHPDFAECSPSESDYDDEENNSTNLLMGICGVWKAGKSKRLQARIRFFGPLVRVTTIAK